jgi:mono/diheme cytochrome c family protein
MPSPAGLICHLPYTRGEQMIRGVMAAALMATVLVGCGTTSGGADGGMGSARAKTIAGLIGVSTAGKTVYDLNCSSCHGPAGKGTTAGVDLTPHVADSVNELADVVIAGKGKMPPFGTLTDQQIADVIAFAKANVK